MSAFKTEVLLLLPLALMMTFYFKASVFSPRQQKFSTSPEFCTVSFFVNPNGTKAIFNYKWREKPKTQFAKCMNQNKCNILKYNSFDLESACSFDSEGLTTINDIPPYSSKSSYSIQNRRKRDTDIWCLPCEAQQSFPLKACNLFWFYCLIFTGYLY